MFKFQFLNTPFFIHPVHSEGHFYKKATKVSKQYLLSKQKNRTQAKRGGVGYICI